MNPELELTKAGDHDIELHVTDAAGGVSIASVAVIAGNTRPEVMFETPQDGDFVNPGKGGLMNLDWIQFDP